MIPQRAPFSTRRWWAKKKGKSGSFNMSIYWKGSPFSTRRFAVQGDEKNRHLIGIDVFCVGKYGSWNEVDQGYGSDS